MSKVIQEQKSALWKIMFLNWLLENPFLKENDVILKAIFRALIQLDKDKISKVIENDNRRYKQMDEMNEQLDENQREIKNSLGEILKEANLFLKKFDEDDAGENEKKLKNNIIELIKITQAVYHQILEKC